MKHGDTLVDDVLAPHNLICTCQYFQTKEIKVGEEMPACEQMEKMKLLKSLLSCQLIT